MVSKTNVYSLSTSITEARIDRLTNLGGVRPLFVRDTRLLGFGIKVTPQDVKSFFVEARRPSRNGGGTVRVSLGRYPLIPLSEARKTALETLRELRYGSGLAKEPDKENVLLRDVAAAFLADKRPVLRPATITDYTMVVHGPYFAPWMPLPVQEIKRRDVMERYRFLCSKHGIGMANKAIRVLSGVLNYGRAIQPSLEDWANPVRVLAETRVKRQVKPRTSFIPLDQLGTWLEALDAYKMEVRPQEDAARRADVWLLLNLLLMTGLRSNEARSLRSSDVDLQAGTVTIRPEVAKNHRKAVLPLNSWLIDQVGNRSPSSDGYVFQADCAAGYVDNLRRPLQEIHERSGLRVTPHDLRRTYATYLDAIGAPFGVIKQLLNHASGSDITAQYVQKRGVEDLRVYAERVLTLIDSRQRCPAATSGPSQ